MNSPQQRSYVPKFGNWDGDNVPYTAYFENARKEKGGGIRINPNDPEQNPEAFNIVGPRGGGSHGDTPSVRISPNSRVRPRRFSNHRSIYDQQKSGSCKTLSSESGSDKSRSDSSVAPIIKPDKKRSDRNRYGSDSCNPPSPGPYDLNHVDDYSNRSVSVPKFGQWDENDPRSAEGFTVIFNKVKEEKQIAASKFPTVLSWHTGNYQTSHEKQTRKKCCGLF